MLQLVRPHFKTIILTRFETNPRSYSPQELADLLAAGQSPETADTVTVVTAETPAEALSLARKTTGHDGPICGTGSIFLAAELRNLLRQSDGTN